MRPSRNAQATLARRESDCNGSERASHGTANKSKSKRADGERSRCPWWGQISIQNWDNAAVINPTTFNDNYKLAFDMIFPATWDSTTAVVTMQWGNPWHDEAPVVVDSTTKNVRVPVEIDYSASKPYAFTGGTTQLSLNVYPGSGAGATTPWTYFLDNVRFIGEAPTAKQRDMG